jgi:hypothetical protein
MCLPYPADLPDLLSLLLPLSLSRSTLAAPAWSLFAASALQLSPLLPLLPLLHCCLCSLLPLLTLLPLLHCCLCSTAASAHSAASAPLLPLLHCCLCSLCCLWNRPAAPP